MIDINKNKDYYYISNAVDYEHFKESKNRIGKRPILIKETDKPILGYYGAFSSWLDYNKIKEYADDGKYHIVMIGGIRSIPKYNIRIEHPNITWINHVSYEKLPYYLSWFDKCFIPFKDSKLIRCVNPCKLWEYSVSKKEIIKYNVNMPKIEKIITYKEVCYKLENIIDNKLEKFYKNINENNYKYNLNKLTELNTYYINNLNNTIINNKKPTFIFFSMIDYYFRIQRSQHFARILANNGFKVFYLKTTLTNDKNNISKICDNLFEVNLCCKTGKPISVYTTELNINDINSIIESINELKKKYNFNYFISIIMNPFWYQVCKNINNTIIVFDCCDYTKGFNTHSNIILDSEEDMLDNEYIIFSSLNLVKMLDYKKKDYKLIRNGCDFDYFNKIEKVEKNKKVIGYYGAISDWFDVDLVEYIIKEFQEYDFHLIGSVYCIDKEHENKIKNLDRYSNVTLFGEIPYKNLKDYLNKFDVGLIPFIINDLIKCTNPVKLYEMLSMGLPVVMVDLPDVNDLNSNDLYYLSKTKEDFKNNIENILNNNNIEKELNNKEKRIKYASKHTWEERVSHIINLTDKLNPFISIVLLCWNHWTETKRCIESVLQNTNYNKYELVIVNNNSTDETKEELKEYNKNNNIKIVNNNINRGFAGGMNIGTLNSSYEYIVLLNNDTIVNKNWLFPLIKPLILNNYSCGSPITNNCGNEIKQFIKYDNPNDLLQKADLLQKYNKYKCIKTDRIPFFCPVVKKEDFYSIGLLDVKYKVGGWEDDDLLEKMKLYSGNSNYYTYGSFVYHMESLTMKDTSKEGKDWTKQNNNREIFEKKWNKQWITPQYKMDIISVKLDTNQPNIHHLISTSTYLNNKLYEITDNNYKIILSDKYDENNLCVIKEEDNIIYLKYKSYDYKLDKKEWNVFNLYSIINTCLFC